MEEGINVDRLPKVVKSINKINEEGGNFSRDYYTWRREFVCEGGKFEPTICKMSCLLERLE